MQLPTCSSHKNQAFAYNKTENLELSQRFICAECFQEQKFFEKIIPIQQVIKEAQLKLQNFQQQIHKEQENQIQVIKQFMSNINEQKENLNSFFKALESCSESWISQILKKQQNIDQLECLEIIDKFYIKQNGQIEYYQNYQDWQININTEYYKYIQQTIEDVFQSILLRTYQSQLLKIFINEEEGLIINNCLLQSMESKNGETPKLPLLCNFHKKEIIHIDINSQTPLVKRALCTECLSSTDSKTMSVETFASQWNEFIQKKFEKIQIKKHNMIQQIENLKQQIQIMNEEEHNKISEAINYLNNTWLQQIGVVQVNNQTIGNINLNTIQQIAQEFSNQDTVISSKEEIGYNQLITNINDQIKKYIENIQEIHRDQLNELIKLMNMKINNEDNISQDMITQVENELVNENLQQDQIIQV